MLPRPDSPTQPVPFILQKVIAFIATSAVLALSSPLQAKADIHLDGASTATQIDTLAVISGVVSDSTDGVPLAAVNVMLLDLKGFNTGQGAFTNMEGFYHIDGVKPGIYKLRASMVGFETTVIDSVPVLPSGEVRIYFSLTPVRLKPDWMYDPHDIQRLDRRRAYSEEHHYQAWPSETLRGPGEILALQSSVYFRESIEDMVPLHYDRGLSEVHMRGGRDAEVAFMIDGMQVTDLLFGGRGLDVNGSALDELVVITGGMPAEFGNAMSGVVNCVTRVAGRLLEGGIDLTSSEFSGQTRDDVRDMTTLEGYVGGHLPSSTRLRFFLSGYASTTRDYLVHRDDVTFDTYPDEIDLMDEERYSDPSLPCQQTGPDGRGIHPMDIYSGWLGYGFDNTWSGLANLTYRITPSSRLTCSFINSWRNRVPWTFPWRYSMLWGLPADLQEHYTFGTNLPDAESDADIIPGTGTVAAENEKNILVSDSERYAVIWTQQLAYGTSLSIKTSYFSQKRSMRVKRWVNADGYRSDRSYFFPDTGDTLWHPTDPMVEVTLQPFPFNESDPGSRRYGYSSLQETSFRSEGSDRFYSDSSCITRSVRGDVTSQIWDHHQIKTGFSYRYLTIDQREKQRLDWISPDLEDFNRRNHELGLYWQSTLETEDVVLTAGLRYDRFWTEREYWVFDPGEVSDWYIMPIPQLTDYRDVLPWKKGKVKKNLAPRFSAAFPLTEQTLLYTNYGHYYQIPEYRSLHVGDLYLYKDTLRSNPDLDNERTIQYEVGYIHQLNRLWGMVLTLWGKESSRLVGSFWYPPLLRGVSNPYSWGKFHNSDYLTARGLDFTLQREFLHCYRVKVAYSLMTTQTNRDDPRQGYREEQELDSVSMIPHPAGWDLPHRIIATVEFITPGVYGPKILGVRPFGGISAHLVYRGSSGMPYTEVVNGVEGVKNAERRPWTQSLDLWLGKDFEIWGVSLGAYAKVRNLLDRRNVRVVYTATGEPDDPGESARGYSDQYDRWHYFGTPRTIDVGIRIRL